MADWQPYITCPHCGFVDGEPCDYPRSLQRDGDETEMDCSACGCEFRVTLAVTYEYQTTATKVIA